MQIPQIFNLNTTGDFEKITLEVFQYQSVNNKIYAEFLNLLGIDPESIIDIKQIPFLPVSFFKTHKIVSNNDLILKTFFSSATTGIEQSKHHLTDLSIYETSFTSGFKYFYDDIQNYTILALLPSYLEREGSSLIFMVDSLIKKSNSVYSGFYLHNLKELSQKIIHLDSNNRKVILIGVSYALLDLLDIEKFNLKNTIIMETGGMKGKRKELVKEELHQILCKGFGVESIHSEYGMTELLSQAYSKGNGIFNTPPWMKILIRDTEDALTILPNYKAGGINVIDLANVNSCSFIATQDLGKAHNNHRFEILGRFDNSDIRGCNLLVV
jgi:hypothetical protein